jgi:hypothetical protein
MALQYSPKIVQDSLVMCLDASQNKSYPTDLPVKNGLVMWMDAADDTTFSYSSGTTVTQWRDKSGLNNHMVPISAGPTRSSALNSRKVLAFTTAQTIGSITFNMETSANTVFVVSRLTGTTNARVLTAYYNNWLLGHWGTQVNKYYAEGWVYLTTVTADTVWRMYMGDWSGSSTDLASFYSNGTELANGSAAATAGPKGLGINFQAGEPSTCEAAEIIVFNRVLSATERKQVNTYLGQKWGISNTDRSIIDLAGNDDNGLLGNGTVANIPAYDFYNKGTLRFDGSNDYVFLSNSQLNISSTITVEAWVKYNAQGGYNARAYSVITCKGYPWTWLLEDQSGQFNFRISTSVNSDSNVNSSYSHGLNTWNHVVGTYDGTSQKIYVDGVLRNTVSLTGTINTSSNDALVGLYNYGDYCLTGNVGAVRVYNKALSAVEVAQNYEAQKSKFANTIVQQGLVLNLDAGNPYSYAGAGAAWYDVSGSGYVSSLTNTQTYNSDNGGSINFNGSTESVSAGPNSNLFLADMTAEVWIKITAMSGDWVRIIGTGSDPRTFGLWYYVDGRILWQRTGSSAVNPEIFPATPVLTVGSWAHVAATTIGMSHVLYLNGVSIGTNPSAGGPWGNSNTAITIGYAGYHAYSNSNIASARLYTRGLSAAEILQNYNATKGRFGL